MVMTTIIGSVGKALTSFTTRTGEQRLGRSPYPFAATAHIRAFA